MITFLFTSEVPEVNSNPVRKKGKCVEIEKESLENKRRKDM